MLIKFSLDNYLSFRDQTELSMLSTVIKEHASNTFLTEDGKVKLLNGVLMYGSNGGGKSNYIDGLAFMKDFVINSSKQKQANESIEVTPFLLSTETIYKPSTFEIEASVSGIHYKYRFSVNYERVHSEYLAIVTGKKERSLFERTYHKKEHDYSFFISEDFKKSDPIDPKIVRDNALLISVSSQFNGEVAQAIVDWFQSIKILSGTNYLEYIDYTAKLLDEPGAGTTLKRLLVEANLGFIDVEIERKTLTPDMLEGFPSEMKKTLLSMNKDLVRIKTVHAKREKNGRTVGEVQFDLMTDESLGSQKFFALLGPIYDSLKNGHLLIIDELDARLHPYVSRLILDFYLTPANNPRNAQFIFTTHNPQFLNKDILRRDQLLFVNKSEEECSEIYSIYSHEKNLRNDASYDKEYLSGELGAVPFDEKQKEKGKQLRIWQI